ncbi:MAG TPA: serine/threonine-protein kinase, partial [Polyangiaceae bacterium]
CEALAEAHSHGIIHRDLKPQNLFVTRGVDGRNLLKVLDFGISKLEGVAENLSLTHTTEVVGSPNYMSPEQLRAARLADVRSDIWSLGVIFYELLSGGMPFNAETLAHLCAMVIAEPPRPIRELLPAIAPDLEAIVNRCLEKDPAKRYQSVAELAAALEPFADAMQSTTAQRIAAVASSGSYPSLPSSAKLVVNERSHNTSIGWGQTEVATTKKSLAPVFAAIAVGLLVVGGGSWLALRSKGPTPASSSDVVTTTTPIPSTMSSAPETTSASATPSVAPSESAVPTAVATPTTTSSAKPPKPAGTTKPIKPVKPKPGGGIDDLPSERN